MSKYSLPELSPKELAQERAAFELDNLDAQAKHVKAQNAQLWDLQNRWLSGQIDRKPQPKASPDTDPKIVDSLRLMRGEMTHEQFCAKHLPKKETK